MPKQPKDESLSLFWKWSSELVLAFSFSFSNKTGTQTAMSRMSWREARPTKGYLQNVWLFFSHSSQGFNGSAWLSAMWFMPETPKSIQNTLLACVTLMDGWYMRTDHTNDRTECIAGTQKNDKRSKPYQCMVQYCSSNGTPSMRHPSDVNLFKSELRMW